MLRVLHVTRYPHLDPMHETRSWWKPKAAPRVEPTGEPRNPVVADVYYDGPGDYAVGLGLTFRTRADLLAHVNRFVTCDRNDEVVALGGDHKGSFTIRVRRGARGATKCVLFDDMAGVA